MTNFIPIFPLGIVVFPGETLNLHIFEPLYKQLIEDSFGNAKPFGIPSIIPPNQMEMGTLAQVSEIVEVYPDGKMDIKVTGISIFRILEVMKSLPNKLYSGAIVNYPPNLLAPQPLLMGSLLQKVRKLHQLLKINKSFSKPDELLQSYDIAHHVGLSLAEEYELLALLQENQRLEYLKRHLQKTIPVILGTEQLKDRIQLNGHFKEIGGSEF